MHRRPLDIYDSKCRIPSPITVRNSNPIPWWDSQRKEEDAKTERCSSKASAIVEWVVCQGVLSKGCLDFGWFERLFAWSMGQRLKTSRERLLLESDVRALSQGNRRIHSRSREWKEEETKFVRYLSSNGYKRWFCQRVTQVWLPIKKERKRHK